MNSHTSSLLRPPVLTAGIHPLVDLVNLPTAVESLPSISPHAFIKRDDRIHHDYGGNKIRKLSCVIAQVKALGKRHIVTFGAVGTNHGVATAMACQQYGLDCTVLLFDQEMNAGVKRNLYSMAYYGARLVYCGSLINTVARFYAHPRRLDSDYYFLYAGSSTPLGAASFVYAAFELAQQVQQGNCPAIQRLYCATSSGGTLAGLTLGCQLAGLDTHVIGVRVVDSHLAGVIPICTPASVKRLMRQTLDCFEPSTLTVRASELVTPMIDDDYFGAGYGIASAEGDAAIASFAKAGIALDTTYSAKGAAAFLADSAIHSETVDNILFWMTYNSRDMTDKIAQVTVGDLPPKLCKVYGLS